jgi:16S rRNA (cytosine967-C5)-methyltransferase
MDTIQDTTKDFFITLRAIFLDKAHASKAIAWTFQEHKNWDDTQRAIFADTIYDLIRYWRLLWFILGKEPSLKDADLHTLITIYTTYKKNRPFISDDQRKRFQDATKIRALRESIPDWLDLLGEKTWGSRWDSLLHALNQPSRLTLRVNTLKTTLQTLNDTFSKLLIPVTAIDFNPDALVLEKKTNVFKLESFKSGFFEVQDAASQMVSRLLSPQPGMRVVDACAGEGGKTLHLSALMKNKGKILALDTEEWKLKELRRRAIRAGADNIETKQITSLKTIKRLHGSADRLLLDVPCSGLGTLQKNPGIKWMLTLEDIKRLTSLQYELLTNYCPMVKNNGILAYSACSILPLECEHQIQSFLKQYNNFQFISEQRFFPDTDHTDGFYIALLKRSI